MMAWLFEASLLTGVNKWLGIAIAIVAAFSASPRGSWQMAASSARWIARRISAGLHFLARFLPFLRREVTIPVGTATGTLHVHVGAIGEAEVWTPSASVEEKIEALRGLVSETRQKVHELSARVDAEAKLLRSEIAESEQHLLQGMADLRAQVDRANQDAATIDARSLPVIAVGILFAGAPEELARMWFPVNWMVTVAAASISAYFIVKIWAGYRRAPDGSRLS